MVKLIKLVSVFFPFLASDWTDQSDSLRGGVSFSKLDIAKNGKSAVFSGNLNTSILNAGFASQRLTGNRFFDWSAYKGLQLEYETPDCSLVNKTFTVIVRDRLQQGDNGPPGSGVPIDPELPPGPDTPDFEFNWKPPCSRKDTHKKKYIRPKFSDFTPQYRGSPFPGEKLNLKTVRRISIMVRSFDETRRQDGDFKLKLNGFKLWK